MTKKKRIPKNNAPFKSTVRDVMKCMKYDNEGEEGLIKVKELKKTSFKHRNKKLAPPSSLEKKKNKNSKNNCLSKSEDWNVTVVDDPNNFTIEPDKYPIIESKENNELLTPEMEKERDVGLNLSHSEKVKITQDIASVLVYPTINSEMQDGATTVESGDKYTTAIITTDESGMITKIENLTYDQAMMKKQKEKQEAWDNASLWERIRLYFLGNKPS